MSAATFIDTHIHLDDAQFADDLDSVLAEACAAGVSAFVNIGYGPERWESTLLLAALDPRVYYTLGLHPNSTDEWSTETFDYLSELVRTTKPVGIGEIGLDYYWTTDNKVAQQISFEAQIELAVAVDLPIVIHQRSAAVDVAAILRSAPATLRVVLHSFDGDSELGALAQERGWLIGVGGLMTRRQNDALREDLRSFPISQIVLETDSPYLIPSGIKSRRNTPASIPLIAERLAILVGRSVEEIAAITTRTATDFFRLRVPLVTA